MDVFGHDLKPRALMADASDAISNGFKEVFGEHHVRLMCFFT